MASTLSVKTAFVLAGGKGERLRPLTDDRPKPMVEVAGAPILVHHLRWLRENGIERAVILTGYMHEVIDAYFSEPRIDGLTVDCIAEDRPLGRGGAFKNGFERSGCTDTLVIATNGDVLNEPAHRATHRPPRHLRSARDHPAHATGQPLRHSRR